MSLVSPNIRTPCPSGWSRPQWTLPISITNWSGFVSGSCTSGLLHLPGRYVSASYWVNSTMVSSPTTASVVPYERPEIATAPNCSPWFEEPCPPNMFCGKPQDTSSVNVACSCSVDSPTSNCIEIKVGAYTNCFTNTNTTTSIFIPDYGAKAIAQRKAWHGRLKYTSREYGAWDTFSYCGGCVWHNDDTHVNDDTHYVGASGTATVAYSVTSLLVPATFNGTATFTTLINTGSGNYSTENATTSSTGTTGDPETDAGYLGQLQANLDTGATAQITDIFGEYINNFSTAFSINGSPASISGTPGNWSMYWTNSYEPDGLTPTEYTSALLSVTANEMHYTQYGQAFSYAGGGLIVIIPLYSEDLEIYDNTYYRLQSFQSETTALESTVTWTTNITLSDTYTSAQVQIDLQLLFSNWLLSDDLTYPWRTDSDLALNMPLLSYSEKMNNDIGPQFNGSGSIDYGYDGSVIGKPLPAGYQGWWSPDFANWAYCNYTDPESGQICYVKYIESWGATSQGTPTPSATQWLNAYDSSQFFQGAFSGNGYEWTTPASCNEDVTAIQLTGDPWYWAVRYAEKIIQKNSINYARPCGEDRLVIKEGTNSCIDSYDSGSKIINADTSGTPFAFAHGDLCFVCGTGELDGLWTVDNVNPDDMWVLTLDTLLAPQSQFASVPIPDCGSGVVGGIAYPSASGICGRTGILSASYSNPVTCTLSDTTYLLTGDMVVVSASVGSNINGIWKVQVIDTSNIILSGSMGSGSGILPYTGSGQIYSLGAIDWQWNDNSPKGAFSSLQWAYNFRDVGEYTRLFNFCTGGILPASCDSGSCTCGAVPASNPRAFLFNYGLSNTIASITCSQNCYMVQNSSSCPINNTIAYFSPIDEKFSVQSGSVVSLGWQWAKMDTQYSSLWQGLIKQYVQDPLFVAPPCICGESPITPGVYDCSGIQLVQDDGTCHTDTEGVEYYPLPPLVEAECSPANTGNSAYTNIVGCLTVAQMQSSMSGSVCGPPNNNNAYNVILEDTIAIIPYVTYWQNMVGCVCDSGVFGNTYLQDGISCVEVSSPPP